MRKWLLVIVALLAGALTIFALARPQPQWSSTELKKLRSLWIGSLPALPPDPSDRVADNPRAAQLGRELFFDTRLSSNGEVACASCHEPNLVFQDGLPLGHGVGITQRRTPSLIGAAYNPWLFWDGRKDSLWSQALTPLEGRNEQAGNRLEYVRIVRKYYADDYTAIFGPLPNVDWSADWAELPVGDQKTETRVFVNMGKAIEAYERTLTPRPALFDRYAAAVLQGDLALAQTLINQDQAAGLKLFIGKGDCTMCHNTPLFSDHGFHNTGVPAAAGQAPDPGWADGLPLMLNDEFGCKGPWSDAGPAGGCVDRRYLIVGLANEAGAFKTPSLRNVAERAPYMHAGQFATLVEVLHHYSAAPSAPIGMSELGPHNFTDQEIQQLIAFLGTLSDESTPRSAR